MHQVECGLCGRTFFSAATDGATCPSCGFVNSAPVAASEAPSPVANVDETSISSERVEASMSEVTSAGAEVSASEASVTEASAFVETAATGEAYASEAASVTEEASASEYASVTEEAGASEAAPVFAGLAAEEPVFEAAHATSDAPADEHFAEPIASANEFYAEPVAAEPAPVADLSETPTDVADAQPYQPEAMSEAEPETITSEPAVSPDEAPTLPGETFAAMASAPQVEAEPDQAATHYATPEPQHDEPAEVVAPIIAQEPVVSPLPFEAAEPPTQPEESASAPLQAEPAEQTAPSWQQTQPSWLGEPNPNQGAPVEPPTPQPVPEQPVFQSAAGFPPSPANPPSTPYGYAPPATPMDATQPMASGQQPMFAAPYGGPGGPPTYPGMMVPPQPPEKQRGGRLVGLIAGVVALALVLGFAGVLAFNGGLLGHNSPKPVPTATATPSAAQIMAKVQAFTYTDASFTMTLNFTDQGQTITGTGSGKITKDPSRADMQFAFPITAGGSTYNVQIEVIVDGSTTYTMISGVPGLATNGKWVQSSTSAGAGLTPFDPSQVTNLGGSLPNATLVGPETLNGVPVWHLKGTDSTSSSSSLDFYVRQDNYQPVKADFTETGATSGSLSIVFTGFNTGITIATPPADQVTQG